jgi:hypothetical protein
MCEHSRPLLAECDASHLTNIVWALGRLGARPDCEWLEAAEESSMQVGGLVAGWVTWWAVLPLACLDKHSCIHVFITTQIKVPKPADRTRCTACLNGSFEQVIEVPPLVFCAPFQQFIGVPPLVDLSCRVASYCYMLT